MLIRTFPLEKLGKIIFEKKEHVLLPLTLNRMNAKRQKRVNQ